jgi:hypothetical protein
MELYGSWFDSFFSNKMASAVWKMICFKEILVQDYLFCFNFKL